MLYFVVFGSGAMLMSLEMVGSRILAPYFGTSIFVWGSLIGVFLGALSIGYFLGGALSDRAPRTEVLAAVLVASGATVAVIPLVSTPVQAWILGRDPGPQLGPLLACMALFFVPSVFMGMVSPYAIKLKARDLDRVGNIAGRLYGISTFGSILGTLATSFYLIPALGVQAIIRSLGAGLMGLGLLALVSAGARRRTQWAAVAALICLVLLTPAAVSPAGPGRVVYEAQTLYHQIYVVDSEGVRYLKFNNSFQGGMLLDDPYQSSFPYADYFHLSLVFNPEIKNVLVVGLGGGMAPKRFHRDYPHMSIDAVEIDPVVVRVARQYFHVPEDDRLRLFAQDGRQFVQKTDQRYDLVILDAYYADSIPFHLTTVEFFREVKACLNPGGVVAFNMIGAVEGRSSKLFRTMHRTFQTVFPHLYSFPIGMAQDGQTGSIRNVIVFGTASDALGGGGRGVLVARMRLLAASRVSIKGFEGFAADFWEKVILYDDVEALTDDHAPVDTLLHVYRQPW
ncbi:MAG: fused MFS/spermidine synthase [Bacillota bacterium]